MKKRNLTLLLIALMMITVVVISVSCKKEPVDTSVTVTFDTQGATTNAKIDPVTVDPGTVVAKPKKTPKRTGFVFLGWFKDKDGKVAYDFKAPVNESLTIYACWLNQTEYEHSDPILPKGSVALNGNSFTIPMDWSVDPEGKKDLPAVKYSFSGERTAETNVSDALVAAVENTDQSFFAATPKNIIFLFSDGWGVTEVNMSREYKGKLILDSLPYATESKTDCYSKFDFDKLSVASDYSSHKTTDSPAGGTQVLSGYKTRYGYIALDVDGNPKTTLIEAAHAKGWKTANVTNDNIVDATPAAAMLHDTNRYHSDVLYYKALTRALVNDGLDLLMGWDWGMDTYFGSETWAEKLLDAEKGGIKDAIEEMGIPKFTGSDPVAYFKGLTTNQKAKMAGFSIYYYLWESQNPARFNSYLRWQSGAAGEAELAEYEAWLGTGGAGSGLATAIAALDLNPSTAVNRYTSFKDVVNNDDFSNPILGSWLTDGNDYESSSPNRGYLINGTIGKNYPSWPEMVAYTLYQMDKEADEAGTGFFCIIENTCTDGWGHSGNSGTKVYSMMNEVQCFDEGVAIAVKYVLEHPDTLLVVSADHETGGFILKTGWEKDFTKISSSTTGHSSQRVPLYAFGAGADKFSAEQINAKFSTHPNAGVEEGGKVHEGWITGALMGELMTGSNFGLTGVLDYKGQGIDHGTNDDPYGGHLYD